MIIGLRDRTLEKLAYCFYIHRKKRKCKDYEDSKKNWRLANKLLGILDVRYKK